MFSTRPAGGCRTSTGESRRPPEQAALHARMGREESKEQAKAAQREKEAAAHAKKQERKDKMWEKGAKDTSKADGAAAASAEAAERKAAAAAQVRVLARLAVAADGAGACVDAPGLATHPCTLAPRCTGPMSRLSRLGVALAGGGGGELVGQQ